MPRTHGKMPQAWTKCPGGHRGARATEDLREAKCDSESFCAQQGRCFEGHEVPRENQAILACVELDEIVDKALEVHLDDFAIGFPKLM